jgi:ABC-2 type transport system ATP-binding protein
VQKTYRSAAPTPASFAVLDPLIGLASRPMIELRDVTKSYRAKSLPAGREGVRALDGVTLDVEPGSAVGVVGLNGAGKSTLLRILLGYLRSTSGTVRVGGLPPRAYVQRHGVAYVPERVAIPGRWTVRGALRAYAMLGDIGDDAWNRVDGAMDRLGLLPLADRSVRALSKGNLQRLAIAQALIGDRRLMVLDEPTDGLDPVWIAELRSIITEWLSANPERILVLASHNLAEVERVTRRVFLLHNGRLAGEVTPTESGTLEEQFLGRVGSLEAARG